MRVTKEFVRLLCARGAVLFVAGDDDQSITRSGTRIQMALSILEMSIRTVLHMID